MSPILRFMGRTVSVVLILVGLIPLTPVIWLLVLVRSAPSAPPRAFRLHFWQTQTIGVALVVAGLALFLKLSRPTGPRRP